ncbi:hypothetical protein B0H12DRAFT_1328794 [Mycena haematopus]|nr:hypothetical protein B0H12DRAFT_1328794 [Mycena haematopus]
MVGALDTMLRTGKAKAGIPNMPGENPGESVTFTLEIKIVGCPHSHIKDSLGQKRNVEITFDVVKVGWYDIFTDTEIETSYREFIERIGPELMHNSEKWACLQCDLPATDIDWTSMYTASEHLYQRCTIIITAACDTCAAKMQRAAPKMVEMYNRRRGTGYSKSPITFGTIPRPNALGSGLSSGCLICRKELQSTVTSRSGMSRCGKCKLVRYCSVACQTQDWARHKTICRVIQNVSRSERKEEERVTAAKDHETRSEECEISTKDLATVSKPEMPVDS